MYKTVWSILDETETEKIKSTFTYYHFGKTLKLPHWYFKENHVYTLEVIWNIKLVCTFEIFIKCLFHKYIVK